MIMPTFVNLQGFIIGKKFVMKEVAVLRRGAILPHYIFKCPIPWSFLTKSEKYCVSWLSAYHHGLQWEDGMIQQHGETHDYNGCNCVHKQCTKFFSFNRKLRLRAIRHGSSKRIYTSKIDRAQGVPSLTARSAKSPTTIEGKPEILGMSWRKSIKVANEFIIVNAIKI
ncbi:hypothetical protein ALC57_11194 [Trachymyrmex cornetzi]|uniref:Uncharacterized protein n=1 Tax=Trachymyrmex cornetzi TaxID=471704 RepID=A0A151J2Z1_9HYME|nr:hypothetical protein ALC57_11194 [Trachymyrmex cornetzi]